MAINAQSSSRLRFDEFEVDLRSGEVWKHGTRLRLQDQPFQVLHALVERRGEIVTREELKQTLWPAETFVDFDDGLNTAVKKIRDLLSDSAEQPRYIETIPRRGYRFVASIELASSVQALVTVGASDAQSALPAPSSKTTTWRRATAARYAAVGVLALVVVFVGVDVGGWRARLIGRAEIPRIESLAVLPLANLSRDPEQDYFADGMTETLIANLAQVKALRVISRTSVMRYKGANKTLPQIARDLNVDAVIEGTVQRSGNRVRVTAQLIQAQTDVHLWAKTYERDSQDVLTMQSDLAQAIVSEIQVRLAPQERQHLASAGTINPDAYNAYLLGHFHSEKRSPAEIAKGIEYFQEAIRIDPNYAQAYAGLANTFFESEVWSGMGIGKSGDKVRANTLKALELDGNLAEAHTLLGWIHFQYDWDWVQAEVEFKRAIELNRNLPSSYVRYAFFLQAMGRHQEALTAIHRSVELDPLSAPNICDEGRILYRARQYQNAVARYQRALELEPGYIPALGRIAEAYEQLGNYDVALAYAEKFQKAVHESSAGLLLVARIHASMGKRREAAAALRTIERNGTPSGGEHWLAVIYCELGDRDLAVAVLEKAVERRSVMPFVFVGPELDPLRSDPRFQQLLHRAGLPS